MWWSKLNTIKFKDNVENENVTAPLKKERCVRIPYNTVISIQTSLDFAKADVRIADVYENVKPDYTSRIFLDKQAIPNSGKYHYSLKIRYSSSLPKNDKIRIQITKNGKKYFSKLFYICSEYQNNKIVAIGTGVASDGTILDNKKYRLSFSFAHYCDFEFFQHEIVDNSVSYSNDNGEQRSLQSKVVPLAKCYFGNRYYLPEWQMIALSICLRFDLVFVYFWTDKKLKKTIGGSVVEILRKGKTAGLTAVEINSPEYVAETSLNCTLSGTFKMDFAMNRLIEFGSVLEEIRNNNTETISMELFDGDEVLPFDVPVAWLTSPLPYYYIDRENFSTPKIFKNRLPKNARLTSLRKLNIPDNFLNENVPRVIDWQFPPVSKIGNDTFEKVTLDPVGRVTGGEVTVGKNFNLALPNEQLILTQGELNGGNPNTPFFFKKDIVIKNREITPQLTPSKKIKKVEGCEIRNNVVLDGCEILNCEVKLTNDIVTLNNCNIENSFNKKKAGFLGMDNKDSYCKNSFNWAAHILPLTSKFKEVEDSFIAYYHSLPGTIEAQLINSAGMSRNVALSSNYFDIYDNSNLIITAKDILGLNDDGGLTLLGINGTISELQEAEWDSIRVKISHGDTIYSDGFFNFEAYPNIKTVDMVALDNYAYTANAFKYFEKLQIPYSVFKSQFQTGDCFCNIYDIQITDDVTDVFQSDVYYIPSNLVEVTNIITSVRIIDLLSPLYPDIIYHID